MILFGLILQVAGVVVNPGGIIDVDNSTISGHGTKHSEDNENANGTEAGIQLHVCLLIGVCYAVAQTVTNTAYMFSIYTGNTYPIQSVQSEQFFRYPSPNLSQKPQ